MNKCKSTWHYSAWTSIYCGLVEGLAHCKGDVSGPHASRRLNGEAFSLLCNFNSWFGGGRDCNFPQKDIYAYRRKEKVIYQNNDQSHLANGQFPVFNERVQSGMRCNWNQAAQCNFWPKKCISLGKHLHKTVKSVSYLGCLNELPWSI